MISTANSTGDQFALRIIDKNSTVLWITYSEISHTTYALNNSSGMSTPYAITLNFSAGDTFALQITTRTNTASFTVLPNSTLNVHNLVVGPSGPTGPAGGPWGASGTNIYNTNSGNVGIGLSNPTFLLQLGSDSAAKPTTSTWAISSDERVKESIEYADTNKSYELIKKLPLKSFSYSKEYLGETKTEKYIGFIAQDIEKILPQCVKTNTQTVGKTIINDFKTLDVDQINKNLIGAVQQLMKRVDNLDRENSELKKLVLKYHS